jgi:hypothetical protein
MDPKPSPPEMSDLTVIEQQLISRISPCIGKEFILSISIITVCLQMQDC